MDELLYLQKQKEASEKFEALCKRCGSCCGLFDNDPCLNLAKSQDGRYFCKIYEARLGIQETVSGKPFTCVSIRDLLKFDLPYSACVYARHKI
ncbi:MAG: hypothetical protein ABIH18_08040 [Candidatus Omnitrophota bacterium]